ncbi:MAG: PilN domain-containing protein [Clostridia bacterium]|nr:PilN domain-containing protein [Clostridia bacterium]
MKDINLLPEEIKATPATVSKQAFKLNISPKVIIISALGILFVIISILVPTMYMKMLDISLKQVNEKLKDKSYSEVISLNSQISAINTEINAKNDILKSIDKQSYPVTDILNTVKFSVPKGCYLYNLKYDSKGLEVKGIADSTLTAAEMLVSIDRLGFIDAKSNVDSISIDGIDSNSLYTYDFKFDVGRKDGR